MSDKIILNLIKSKVINANILKIRDEKRFEKT